MLDADVKEILEGMAADTQTAVQFKDEGVDLGTPGTVQTIDFTGGAVTVTRIGDVVTVTISGGGGGDVGSDLIWDAKGDLAVGTAADTAQRLAAGANDTFLVPDSGVAKGLKWITPSAVKTILAIATSDISGFTSDAAAAAPAETTTTIGALTHGATAKTTPVDADEVGLVDSAASNIWKRVTWANVKATLKTYFDTLYTGAPTSIVGISGTKAQFNTAVSDGDILYVGDAPTGSGTSSGTNTGDQTITLTGDVTGSGTGSFAATIANAAVTLAKMANMATASVFYRKTAGSGAPEVQTLATLKTDLGLTGTNSGDQSSVTGNAGTATALATPRNIDGQPFDGTANITVIAPGTHAATTKATPVDADELSLVDSAASNVLKKLTWANLKATLKTYLDTLYDAIGAASTAQAAAVQRANHTGTQSADTLTDGATNKAFLATERTKLSGIATGATANSSDATLLARANHTGTQLAATVSDFNAAALLAAPAETGTTIGAIITGASAAAAGDAVEFGFWNTITGFKKITWANIKATLKTYFDTLYQPVSTSFAANVISIDTTVPAGYSGHYSGIVEISNGITFEIGLGGTAEVG